MRQRACVQPVVLLPQHILTAKSFLLIKLLLCIPCTYAAGVHFAKHVPACRLVSETRFRPDCGSLPLLILVLGVQPLHWID